MEKWFSRAAVLLLPFVFWLNGEQFREPKAMALVVIAVLFLFFILSEKISLSLGFSYFACVISGVYLGREIPYGDILVLSAAAISCLWVSREDNPRFLFLLLEVVGIICAIYGIAQHFGLDPVMHYKGWADHRPVVFFGQHTLYGPFAVSCFAVALFYRHWIRAFLLLAPIILIDSSFTFLSLATVLFIWAMANLKKKVFLSLIGSGALLLAAGFLLFPQKLLNQEALNDKGRFAVWSQVFSLANHHPLFGYGFGSFKAIYPVFQSKELRLKNGIEDEKLAPEAQAFIKQAEKIRGEQGIFKSAHNEFLQVYFEMGLMGVLCIFALISSFLISFSRTFRSKEAWICFSIFWLFLANSAGNFPLHLIPQALLPLWAYCLVMRMGRSRYQWRSYGTLAKPAL